MTKFEQWEVIGPVPIRGNNPGAKFNVEVFENGTPKDVYWRKAKNRELKNKGGFLKFPTDAPITKPALPKNEPPKKLEPQPLAKPE